MSAGTLENLRAVAERVRAQQGAAWFARWWRRVRRNAGVTAVFNGPDRAVRESAAAALATSLDWPLFRVDLSALVSKYIGETAENLGRLFNAAEGRSIVLHFEEAESVFGRRGEIREASDRYANIETSFDLFEGTAIVSTDLDLASADVLFDPSWLTVEIEPVEDG